MRPFVNVERSKFEVCQLADSLDEEMKQSIRSKLDIYTQVGITICYLTGLSTSDKNMGAFFDSSLTKFT